MKSHGTARPSSGDAGNCRSRCTALSTRSGGDTRSTTSAVAAAAPAALAGAEPLTQHRQQGIDQFKLRSRLAGIVTGDVVEGGTELAADQSHQQVGSVAAGYAQLDAPGSRAASERASPSVTSKS